MNTRLAKSLLLVTFATLIGAQGGAEAYNQLTTNGNPITWTDGSFTFHTDTGAFQTAFGGDSHIGSANFELYVNWAHRRWEQEAGSAIEIVYGGTTTLDCSTGSPAGFSYPTNDGINSVGVAAWGGGGGPIAQTNLRYTVPDGAFVETDLCVNSNFDFSVQSDLPGSRMDLRIVLAHEVGHCLGADHTDYTVMNASLGNGDAWVGLWGDDMDFVRDTYGERSHDEFFRELDPANHTWGSEVSLGTTTNLPVGAAVGRNSSGTWYVGRTEMRIGRDRIRFRTTAYRASSSSSWSGYGWYQDVEHGIALTARTADERWAGAFQRRDTLRGCTGTRAFRSDNLFASITANDPVDMCTNQGVGVTYDADSGYFVLAYMASGEGGGSQDQGRLYLRSSSNGTAYPTSSEVETNYYTDTAPQVACRQDGNCVVSFIDAGSNTRYDQQLTFTVNGSGVISLGGSPYSSTNWVYFAPSPSTTTSGSPDRTFIVLSNTANAGSGAHTFWSRYDTSFPVNQGSWLSLGETSMLPVHMGYNANRYWSYAFYPD